MKASSFDRFVFTLNPYYHLSDDAARAISDGSPNASYLNAIYLNTIGMSLAQVASLKPWSPVPSRSYRLLQNPVTYRSKPPQPFLSASLCSKVLDAPGISEIPSPNVQLISSVATNMYAVIASKNKPYLVSIQGGSSTPHDVFPTFDAPLSHITAVDSSGTVVVADTTGSVYLTPASSARSSPIVHRRNPPSSMHASHNAIYAATGKELLHIDLRATRSFEATRLSFKPRIVKPTASDYQLLIASRNTVHLFDTRQRMLSLHRQLPSPISAMAQSGSLIYLATIEPSPKLATYTSDLTPLCEHETPSPITDIVTPKLRNTVVTLHNSIDCRCLCVWKYSAYSQSLNPAEYGSASFPSRCHGAIALDQLSLGTIFPDRECICFWSLFDQKTT